MPIDVISHGGTYEGAGEVTPAKQKNKLAYYGVQLPFYGGTSWGVKWIVETKNYLFYQIFSGPNPYYSYYFRVNKNDEKDIKFNFGAETGLTTYSRGAKGVALYDLDIVVVFGWDGITNHYFSVLDANLTNIFSSTAFAPGGDYAIALAAYWWDAANRNLYVIQGSANNNHGGALYNFNNPAAPTRTSTWNFGVTFALSYFSAFMSHTTNTSIILNSYDGAVRRYTRTGGSISSFTLSNYANTSLRSGVITDDETCVLIENPTDWTVRKVRLSDNTQISITTATIIFNGIVALIPAPPSGQTWGKGTFSWMKRGYNGKLYVIVYIRQTAGDSTYYPKLCCLAQVDESMNVLGVQIITGESGSGLYVSDKSAGRTSNIMNGTGYFPMILK